MICIGQADIYPAADFGGQLIECGIGNGVFVNSAKHTPLLENERFPNHDIICHAQEA